jgi:hypothetical protein
MKRLLASLFLVLFVGACETQTFSALDEKSPEWRLVFQDEFSGRGRPDPDKWISKEYNRRPNDDGPDGWWDPTNAYLNGSGKLVLKTSVIENRNPDEDSDPYDYASAMVSTEGKFEQAFGRYEVRAKLPHSPGARDDLRLDLGGTLEDVEDTRVAQDAGSRIPAQSRCRHGSAARCPRGPGHAGAQQLGHPGLQVAAPVVRPFPKREIGQLPRDHDLDRHHGKLARHAREIDQRLAELLAVLRVLHAAFERDCATPMARAAVWMRALSKVCISCLKP